MYTTGNNPNLIGHQYANEYIEADYSDQIAIKNLSKECSVIITCLPSPGSVVEVIEGKRGLLKYVVNQLMKVYPRPKWVKTMSPHIIIVRFDISFRLALSKVLKFSLVLFLYGSSIFI